MKNKHYGDFGEHLAEVAADGEDITVPVPSRRPSLKYLPSPPPATAPVIPDAWPVPIHCAQPWFINLADLIARNATTKKKSTISSPPTA